MKKEDYIEQLNFYLSNVINLNALEETDNNINRIKLIQEKLDFELGINLAAPTKDKDSALIISMFDTTGSIGLWESNLAKEYYNYAAKAIKDKYKNVDEKFISFNTQAEEVDCLLDIRFGKGGTIASCALNKAKDIVKSNLDKNIYVFLFSDGDNLTSNNSKCLDLTLQLLGYVNHFQYVEANQFNRHSTLMAVLKNISDKKFNYLIAKTQDDALKGIRFNQVLEAE